MRYYDITGLEVSMVCRTVDDWRTRWLGVKHCFVAVWHWEEGSCGDDRVKILDSQYSIAGGRTPLTNPNAPTYSMDRNAWNNPGGDNQHYDIAPPAGMSQAEFDSAVQNAGDNYRSSEPYDAVFGPNSNTAADNIIENAGGIAPNIPGALNQNYGDSTGHRGTRNYY